MGQRDESHATPPEARSKDGGVRSLERALSILEAIARHDGVTLSHLAEELGLYPLSRAAILVGLSLGGADTKQWMWS